MIPEYVDFGDAIRALRRGERVARTGWNGKNMWLLFVEPETKRNAPAKLLPWIGMKTADDCFVPWLASQTDMLAHDWVVLDSSV